MIAGQFFMGVLVKYKINALIEVETDSTTANLLADFLDEMVLKEIGAKDYNAQLVVVETSVQEVVE